MIISENKNKRKLSNKDRRVMDSVHYRDVAERLGILPCDELGSEDEASENETSDLQPAKRQRNDQSQSNDSISLDLRLNDEDQRTSEGLPTSFEGVLSQTPSTSKQSTCVVKTSSLPKVTTMSNATQISDRLNEQQVNNELQKKYLLNQLERSKLAKEKEKIMKKMAEIELKKARLLMNEEIEHKKTMMKLEEDAKRAEIEKWKRSE